MTDEIELISDGDGLAVIGEARVVELFLASEGLPSRELDLDRLRAASAGVSGALKVGAELSANSGRWVKLSDKSVALMKQHQLMKGSAANLQRGVVQAKGGQIKGIVEFARGPGAALTSPAVLAGAAGIMAQIAMQQAMEEITDYLAVIDAKVDDVLRAQKDGVLADMIGVDLVIEEAMTVRKHVGRVSDVTWSKVQGTAMTIARTQAYALRQLDALAEKLEKQSAAGGLEDAAAAAETTVLDWLAVLARCFQLQDGVAILELDRVLDSAPDDLDEHRLGLHIARQNRLQLIKGTTEQLLGRMDAAAGRANTMVFAHPIAAKRVVNSGNRVADHLLDFHGRLGFEIEREALERKRWLVAAGDARDSAIETGVAIKAGAAHAAVATSRVFQRVDLDGDGVPDEARALTAAKSAGGAVTDVAGAVGGRVAGLLKRPRREDANSDQGVIEA